jgi:hypothetical protein
MSEPPMSALSLVLGSEYPSLIGIIWVTPSPDSMTVPVVLPWASLSQPFYYKLKIGCWTTKMPGALNFWKKISAMFLLLLFGLFTGSVSSTGVFFIHIKPLFFGF